MNFQKYFKSTALISNPLCGIGTYKDVLNLATGQITRAIKKLVLTGEESWSSYSGVVYLSNIIDYLKADEIVVACTHYQSQSTVEGIADTTEGHITFSKGVNYRMCIRDSNYTSGTLFKEYLQQQYSNGTPVTVWYVLATSTTEQITVPSGLSGTVEGYLTQDGTPTPTDPIYPVTNDAVGWYAIKNYVRNTTWQDGSTYSRSGGSWSSSLTKKRSRKKK